MSQQQSVFSETEKKAAERYLWWPIYLVREKRRLAGITEAVRGAAVAEPTPLSPDMSLDDTQPAVPDVEELGELLNRIDVALSASEVLPWLEKMEASVGEESKTQGNSLRNEKTIPDDAQKGKNSGRAALLGRKKRDSTPEDF